MALASLSPQKPESDPSSVYVGFVIDSAVQVQAFLQALGAPPPITSLTKVQKGAYYSGIKIYNHQPQLKKLSNEQKPFRSALKRFLYINSFNSMKEYFNYKM
jgi:hypothetical protein